MTWIAGIAPPLGYSILASDVCVTFSNGKNTRCYDCLQKIYPIGPSIIGGFAGSVKIGFRLLSCLSVEFSKAGPNHGWSLDVVSNTWWPRLAKRMFKFSDSREKRSRSQIILVGVHPSKKNGDSPWPTTDVYTFSSPDFRPKKASFNQALGIGSGQSVKKFADALTSLSSPSSGFLQLAAGGPEHQARVFAHILSSAVSESNPHGISNLFQVGIAHRDKFIIVPHEYTTHDKDSETVEFKMPPLARSYDEFRQMADRFGVNAKCAIA